MLIATAIRFPAPDHTSFTISGDDQCDGEGTCKGRDMCVGVKCAPPKNQCQVNSCNSGTGECKLRNKKDGTKCDDENAITVEDRCHPFPDKPAICKGVDKCKDVKCPVKICHAPSKCNYLNGKCGPIGPVLKDGTSCDDDDPNTEKDNCKAGKCAGTKIASCLMITGVFNGPTAKGPNGVEIYAFCDVNNVNVYGLGTAKNGKGSEGMEFAFAGSKKTAKAGEFFYITNDQKTFENYFKFKAEFVWDKIGINGNDAVELFLSPGGKGAAMIDAYGIASQDGTNKDWDYAKGFGYRKDEMGPSAGKFVPAEWQLKGKNALKGKSKNGGAIRYGGAVPLGTYCRKVPCIRLTTTTSTTTTTTTTARATTTSTTTTTTTTTTLGGCMNKLACNYNKDAKGDDGSCQLPKPCHNCKEECICDKDECGVCGGKGPGSDMDNCKSKPNVQVNWVGDKTCDDVHNICVCGWDGGDCCGEANDYKYCKKCKCKDPNYKEVEKTGDCGKCSGKCGKPVYSGDGYCDDENNACGCDWDGGDCCGGSNNYNYCKKCKCLDCKFEEKSDECVKNIKGDCGYEKWKGDKNCDDENNVAGCDWDGGDCCGGENLYEYCKECKCKDCTHVAKGDACIKAIQKGCGAADFVGDKYCDDNK